MQNETMNKEPGPKRKNRKDYLYKVGKLKQNKILYEKTANEQEFNQQPPQQATKQAHQHVQEQMDFDLTLLAPNPTTLSNVLPISFSSFNSKNVKQSFSPQEKKIEPKIDLATQKQQRPQQIIEYKETISKKVEQRQILVHHKPITFDDFDEELGNQLQDEKPANDDNSEKAEQRPTHPKAEGEEVEESSSCSEQEIKGVSITSNSLQGNVVIKITNKKQLVLSRLPPGIILKCIIRRSSDIFNPQFDFYLNNGLKHMMSAKKYSLAKKQIFQLSLELGKYRDRDIIGSIMANTLHNTYWIYKEAIVKQQVEYDIKGTIKYEKMVKNKERQMIVELVVDKNKEIRVDPERLAHDMLENADLKLKNCQSQVKQSSTKNYLLFDEDDKDYQYLKMSKVSDHMFEVEIQHPLSPLQAFAISLTRFDAELK